MPERVIDLLEAVEIQKRHRQLSLVAVRFADALANSLLNRLRFGSPVSPS